MTFTIWKDVQYKTAILNDGMHCIYSNQTKLDFYMFWVINQKPAQTYFIGPPLRLYLHGFIMMKQQQA